MLIEQPPQLYRWLMQGSIWRLPKLSTTEGEKVCYLTFDDGPIPEATPLVLRLLNQMNVQATFFCVGDNVRKYPHLFQQILQEGHAVGNHTYHHLQGIYTATDKYIADVQKANSLIGSPLFRPPHGLMTSSQLRQLQQKGYIVVMQDVVTRDYSKWVQKEQVFQNVMDYTRNGSIIVFHDSLRSVAKLPYALPRTIQFLKENGYRFELIPQGRTLLAPPQENAIVV